MGSELSFEIHGPMYQFECETCGLMGDCWDTEAQAEADIMEHDCLDGLRDWARAEIKRLRSAGDALVAAIRNHDLTEAHLRAWQEARRG